jgi:hypothetical protein
MSDASATSFLPGPVFSIRRFHSFSYWRPQLAPPSVSSHSSVDCAPVPSCPRGRFRHPGDNWLGWAPGSASYFRFTEPSPRQAAPGFTCSQYRHSPAGAHIPRRKVELTDRKRSTRSSRQVLRALVPIFARYATGRVTTASQRPCP